MLINRLAVQIWAFGAAELSPDCGRRKAVAGGLSEPQEHGVEPDQAQCLAVELAHLAEHVGLLDPLDDLPVVDPDVIEEAGQAAVAVKLPGHGINNPSFLQPDRPMSAIGG